jgi:hypothetical protein
LQGPDDQAKNNRKDRDRQVHAFQKYVETEKFVKPTTSFKKQKIH